MKKYYFYISLLIFVGANLKSQSGLKALNEYEKNIATSAEVTEDKIKLMLRAEVLLRFCKPNEYGKYVGSMLSALEKIKDLDQRVVCDIYLLEASLYRFKGDFEESFKKVMKAKRIAENVKDTLLMVRAYNHISSLNNRISSGNLYGISDKATENSKLALALVGKYPNFYAKSLAIQMHAANLVSEKKNSESLKLLIENQDNITKIEDDIEREISTAYNYILLGLSHIDKTKAEQSLLNSLKLAGVGGYRYIASLAAHNLAYKVYLPENKVLEAIKYLENGLQWTDIEKEKIPTIRALIDAYKLQDNSDKALEYSLQYITLKDSIDEASKDVEFARLEALYQSTIKEKKIAELQLENERKSNAQKLLTYFIGFAMVIITLLILGILVVNKWRLVAQNAMQLKDSIFSIVSHDIRSPLLGLNYAAFGFRMGINDKDYSRLGKLVDHLEEKIGDMHFLVENFFYWANLKKGINIHNTSFDIQNEIQHIIQSLEYKSKYKNIEIEITSQISGDKQNILYDRMVFGTVVRNVLDNAIKFSPENSRIKVTLDYSKAQYIISFIDSGPGLSVQDAQRIFLKNRIGGNKSSLENGGSGIGLSICKDLMDAMGDKIECVGSSYGLFVLYIHERDIVG